MPSNQNPACIVYLRDSTATARRMHHCMRLLAHFRNRWDSRRDVRGEVCRLMDGRQTKRWASDGESCVCIARCRGSIHACRRRLSHHPTTASPRPRQNAWSCRGRADHRDRVPHFTSQSLAGYWEKASSASASCFFARRSAYSRTATAFCTFSTATILRLASTRKSVPASGLP